MLASIAGSVADRLLNRVADRLSSRALDAASEPLALQVALARTLARVSREHPSLAAILDDEHVMRDSVPALAAAFSTDPISAGVELATIWKRSLGLASGDPREAELDAAAVEFTRWWLEELPYQTTEKPALGQLLDEALLPGRYVGLDDSIDRESRQRVRGAQSLVGREWVFAELERIADSSRSGYVSLIGGPGVGKSALAAAIASRYDAPAFFFSLRSGRFRPQQCLQHLSAELIERFDLGYQRIPDRAGETALFLERLLLEACAHTDRVWLVIDAVDEAEPIPGTGAGLPLPTTLPDGAFVVLTHRPGERNVEVAPGISHAVLQLSTEDSRQRADIAAYLRSRLAQDPALERALAAAQPALASDEIVERLANASEGNFLYLNYILDDLQRGPEQELEFGAPPQGLESYYDQLWHRQSVVAERDPEAWSRRLLPVIERLAVAAEPVTEMWLGDHTSLSRPDVLEALETWRQLVQRSGDRWGISHASFAAFLAGRAEVDLPAAHRAVADFYLADDAQWAAHGDYAKRHVMSHLKLAGDRDRLFGLVDRSDWRDAQLRDDPSGDRYLSDIAVAWDRAVAEDAGAIHSGADAPPMLRREINCALATAEVHSMASRIPPALLKRLVDADVWQAPQALAVLRRTPGALRQANGVVAIQHRLEEGRASDAIAKTLELVMATAAPVARAQALAALAPYLSDGQRATALEQAFDDAAQMSTADLCHVLEALGPHLSEELLADVFVAATAVDDADGRTLAVTALAPHLTPELAHRALAIAAETTNPYTRANLLVAISGRLAAEHVMEALDAQRGIGVPSASQRVVAALLPRLEGQVRENVIDSMKLVVGIAPRAERAAMLAPLLEHLTDEDRAHRLARATTGAPSPEAAEAIAVLAAHLQPEQLAGALAIEWEPPLSPAGTARLLEAVAPHVPEDCQGDVVAAAAQLDDPTAHARVLVALAPTLSAERLEDVLATAAEIAEPSARAYALDALAERLPEPLLDTALAATPTDAEACTRVLAALAPRLPDARLHAALDVARRAIDPAAKARVLAAVAPHLEEQERSRAIAEALASAAAGDSETTLDLIATLGRECPAEERARALTRTDARPERFVRLVVALAPHESAGERDRAFAAAVEAAARVDVPETRARLLGTLLPHLAEQAHASALLDAHQAAAAIAGHEARAHALADLARMGDDLRDTLIAEAFAAAEMTNSIRTRCEVAAAVAPAIDRDRVLGLLEAAERARDAEALAALVPCVPPELRIRAQASAVMAATPADNDAASARALAAVAGFLPARLLEEARAIACAEPDLDDRIRLLVALAPRIEVDLRRSLLRDALAASSTPEHRARALRGVTPWIVDDAAPAEQHAFWVRELRGIAREGVRALAPVVEALDVLLPFAPAHETSPAHSRS